MIVIDTSALVEATVEAGLLGKAVRQELAGDPGWVAPPHQPLEFLQTMRGLLRRNRITEEQAAAARRFYGVVHISLVPLGEAISERIWELRHNMTAYDAAYIAVAEVMNYPLVTTDSKFVGTPGVRCEIKLIR